MVSRKVILKYTKNNVQVVLKKEEEKLELKVQSEVHPLKKHPGQDDNLACF